MRLHSGEVTHPAALRSSALVRTVQKAGDAQCITEFVKGMNVGWILLTNILSYVYLQQISRVDINQDGL